MRIETFRSFRFFSVLGAKQSFALQKLAIALACVLSFAGVQLHAQQWANDLFPEKIIDFGSVSRNARTEHVFQFKNTFEEDIHIRSVRSSCGCTKALIAREWVRSGESGAIVAQFNTRSFIGKKNASITVVFDQPYYAEVQLMVSGDIMSDIVTNPGEVRFGDVDVGTKRALPIEISYAGRADWEIRDVRGKSEHLEVLLNRNERRGSGVGYILEVRLRDDAPVGALRDELIIVTNDPENSEFTIPVSASVNPPIMITPKLVSLGGVRRGSTIQQRMIVRGKVPFEIAEIICEDERFEFRLPQGKKPVHVVPFSFRGEADKEIRQTVIVRTNLGDEMNAECQVIGQVIN